MSLGQTVRDLWPDHVDCLDRAQPIQDPDHGVVCVGCGAVLGWPQPTVEDEPRDLADLADPAGVWPDAPAGGSPFLEAVARETADMPNPVLERFEADQPGTLPGHTDAVGDETSAVEAGWNDLMAGDDSATDGGWQPGHGPDEAQTAGFPAPGSTPWDEAAPGSAATDLAPAADVPAPPRTPIAVPGAPPVEDPLGQRVVVIDPTLPYGPADVEYQLVSIAARLERGVHFERYWAERRFVAKTVYDQKFARAIVAHRHAGAADVRKALAMVDCEAEAEELLLAETMTRAVADTMHNLRSLQSNYQSVRHSVAGTMRSPNNTP